MATQPKTTTTKPAAKTKTPVKAKPTTKAVAKAKTSTKATATVKAKAPIKTKVANAIKTKAKPAAAKSLRDLFEDSLKDIYWAEKALTKVLPKMAKNATAPELKHALQKHLTETVEHVSRLEQIFKLLGKKAVAKKCDAMVGLIEEGEGIMEETQIGDVRDAGIIAASQKVEHYEMATYGTLYAFATALDEDDVSRIILNTLNEEKIADITLTEIALAHINIDAADKKGK